MSFRQDDGDKDKFNESLHHYTPKKFDHNLHYIPPKIIHPEQKYKEIKTLECDAIEFNGIDSYIDFGTTELSNGSCTISVQIKPSQTQSTPIAEFKIDNTGLLVYNYLEKALIGFRGAGHQWHTNVDTIKINSYNNLIFTYNGGNKGTSNNFKIFINGIEQSKIELGNIGGAFSKNYIGKDGVSAVFFKGLINNTQVYNKELTSTECLYLTVGIPISKEGLVLDIPMINNCYGNTIKDLSGHNNNGTIYNCKWKQKWVTKRRMI